MLLIGTILIDAALKNTGKELASQLQNDILGSGGFMLWAGSFVGVGLIGYVPGLQKTSHYMLALLVVVILIRNGGVFQQAQQALLQASQSGPAPSIAPPADPTGATATASAGTSGAGSNTAGQVGALAGAAVGTAVFPGVGTVVGGLLGGLL